MSTPRPFRETNGAAEQSADTPSVSDVTASQSSPSPETAAPSKQTHGAVKPIKTVNDLLARRGVGHSSVGSFNTIGEYRAFLDNMTTASLHRHAVEDAGIVPIDDRGRLIRRLETEWSTLASRTPGHPSGKLPVRAPYSQAQIDQLDEIKRKMSR